MIRRALRALEAAAAVLLIAASPAAAQLIPIRTVPVASGDQFRLLPSATMGMGGVGYALDDSIGDPWTNPALGSRLGTSLFMGSPTFYSISQGQGGGRSFPVAGMFTSSDWFGGAALALQQIENRSPQTFWLWGRPSLDIVCCCCQPPGGTLSERYGRNLYFSGFAGRRVGDGWSVGVALSAASLEAMDGVDLLYAGADRIEQSGSVTDVRFGALREGARDRVALIVAHDRVSMEHEVSFTDWVWNETLMITEVTRRIELNRDETRTWAAQAAWDRSLDAPGWRIGASGTVNRKSHPEIPNYSIQNIPRDPGTTWAYEAGFGVSMTEGSSTFAVDVAFQPIWSNTWQEADAQDVAASGGRLSIGDRSIENDFFFTNVILRSGVSHREGPVGLQAGIEVRSYDYKLDQVNRVQNTFRDQDESWIEWSPTFGTVFSFSSLDLRYGLRVTTGTGRPGTQTWAWAGPAGEQLSSDFIVAPQGPLTLQDARVLTHQIAVTIPVR